jgi:hypothetical protein
MASALTATAAQNLPRSAGRAAQLTTTEPSLTFHAAPPADLNASFTPSLTAASRTTDHLPSLTSPLPTPLAGRWAAGRAAGLGRSGGEAPANKPHPAYPPQPPADFSRPPFAEFGCGGVATASTAQPSLRCVLELPDSPAGVQSSVGLTEKSTRPLSRFQRLQSTGPAGSTPAGVTTEGESL